MACMTNGLERIAPGLMKLSSYSFAENFRHDLFAGLSVAAVALPVAVAYAQLAGFDPVVGLLEHSAVGGARNLRYFAPVNRERCPLWVKSRTVGACRALSRLFS